MKMSNPSPKIELFSPKKSMEQITEINKKNKENYESSTHRHLNTNLDTVGYQNVKTRQRSSKINQVLQKKKKKQQILQEKARRISQEMNIYIQGNSPYKKK